MGQIGKLECDFITRKANDHAYMQVAFSIAERSVGEREYRPFSRTRDAYLRFLLILDSLLQRRDGVRHLNLLDFIASGLGLEDTRAGGPPLDNGEKREPSQEKSPLNEALRGLVWVAASANRVATVYTSAPKRRREPIFADLCTLLHTHVCPQRRNSVHKRPTTQPATHVKTHSAPAMRSRRDQRAHSGRATSRKSAFRRIVHVLYARGEGGRDGSHAREHRRAGARQSAKGPGSIPSRTSGRMNAPDHTLDASYGPYVLYVLYAVYASYVPYA